MNSKNDLIVSNYFKLRNIRLESYFARVRAGQSEEYRSTFYKDKPIQLVLDNWNKRLGRIRSTYPSLYQFEMDLAKKVGPMSIMQPLNKRLSDIDSYYDLVKGKHEPIDDCAVDALLDEWDSFQAKPIQIRSQEATVRNMKLSTNSGSPYFASKRSEVIFKTLPCATWCDYPDVKQVTSGWDGNACAVLGWRGQEGGPKVDDVKQRVVWMFPFAVNIQELQLYQPLIEICQYYNYIPAWNGNDYVDVEITKLFDTKARKDVIVCTDFTKFDQHFNQVMQDAAKLVIAKITDTRHRNTVAWLEDVFPIKYMIPLMYDYGKVKEGLHGMASGSGGTNCDETIVHRLLQHEVAITHGQQLNTHSMCLGDDGIITYPGITLNDVIDSYSQHGLEMNEDKQYVSTDDCVYLRRWHSSNYRVDGKCVGVYSTMRALGHLLEQERYFDPKFWDKKMVALRQLSILENVKYHPLREEFARFCMNGDKYRLGLDIPGFLTNIQSEAEKARDLMPDFMGYTQSLGSTMPISQWWIVQFLLSEI